MPVTLNGSSSGQVTVTVPAAAGTTTFTIPATTGNAVVDVATQTLTNKTLTAPVISTISNTGTLTLPTSTDTLVGRDTTDTLTNKTLTSPTITSPTITGSSLVTGSNAFGYGTGSGGAVTQTGSRTTGVTLDKSNGAITMFSAAGSTTAATFTVTNSTVAATDVVILSQKSGTNLYDLLVTAVAAGSFNITFRTTGGTSTDAPVINFAVIKGVTS